MDRRGRERSARRDVEGDGSAEAAGTSDRDVALRGLSWIVNPYEDGVVVAIEITLGAAVAGPFDIEQAALDAMIARVLKPQPPGSAAVH